MPLSGVVWCQVLVPVAPFCGAAFLGSELPYVLPSLYGHSLAHSSVKSRCRWTEFCMVPEAWLLELSRFWGGTLRSMSGAIQRSRSAFSPNVVLPLVILPECAIRGNIDFHHFVTVFSTVFQKSRNLRGGCNVLIWHQMFPLLMDGDGERGQGQQFTRGCFVFWSYYNNRFLRGCCDSSQLYFHSHFCTACCLTRRCSVSCLLGISGPFVCQWIPFFSKE